MDSRISSVHRTTDGLAFDDLESAKKHQEKIDDVDNRRITTDAYVFYPRLAEDEFDKLISRLEVHGLKKKELGFFEKRGTENLLMYCNSDGSGYTIADWPNNPVASKKIVVSLIRKERDSFLKLCDELSGI